MGVALQQVIPGLAGKKITAYFELVKPLIEFSFEVESVTRFSEFWYKFYQIWKQKSLNLVTLSFEVIKSRLNNMFELATTDEVDKLGSTSQGGKTKEL